MSSVAVSAEGLPPGPLKYQTWLLKVPIHCEGCKRKVKKVLHSIDGVFMTTIDSQEHKVVVVGDVDADTLIKKLIKSGKQAEIWPESIENGAKPDENCKQDQNDNNGGDNEGDEMSEVDEVGGEVKTIVSTGGGTATGGGEPNGGKKKKKKKKKKKNKGNTDHGSLGSAMSMLNPESAASAPGPTDLDSQPHEDDFRTYQVIDYFPHEHGTSYNSMYTNPISSYMYQPPVNTFAYPSSEMITMMHHFRPPQSDPIRHYEDDYYEDYDDDDYNVGCSVM